MKKSFPFNVLTKQSPHNQMLSWRKALAKRPHNESPHIKKSPKLILLTNEIFNKPVRSPQNKKYLRLKSSHNKKSLQHPHSEKLPKLNVLATKIFNDLSLLSVNSRLTSHCKSSNRFTAKHSQ